MADDLRGRRGREAGSPVDDRHDDGTPRGPDPAAAAHGGPEGGEPGDAGADEADVLRRELERAQETVREAREEAEGLRERLLRARADLENLRRRTQMDLDRAREAGFDSALIPVLTVYDDLGRALQAAESGDPSAIVPGVRSVRETFERQLATLGIEAVGRTGEAFDPDRHEALTAVPRREDADAGTIADVFEVGFVRGDRLIRPARVVVYEQD